MINYVSYFVICYFISYYIIHYSFIILNRIQYSFIILNRIQYNNIIYIVYYVHKILRIHISNTSLYIIIYIITHII